MISKKDLLFRLMLLEDNFEILSERVQKLEKPVKRTRKKKSE